jgi:hypothetical protein
MWRGWRGWWVRKARSTTTWRWSILPPFDWLAAQPAATGISGPKVAILAADQDLDTDGKEEQDSVFSKVSGMFRDSPKIPPTLERALMGGDGDTNSKSSKICVLRVMENCLVSPNRLPTFLPWLVVPSREKPSWPKNIPCATYALIPLFTPAIPWVLSSCSCRHTVGQAAALLACW